MDIKEKSKQEIRELVKKYNKIIEKKSKKKYNEEMTKKDFILPLFRALGWSVEDSNEVSAEEKVSRGRVDYSFRIDKIPKFFLEAKSLKVELDNPKFIEQAINYAWHKGCIWAVLTDFENVKIYNAEWKTSTPLQSHLKTIHCFEFLDRFDELWLLSKESFEQGLMDKVAEKWGKRTKKTSIDKQLLADFTRFRELLSKNITKLNQAKKLTEEDLDECVQRILDRLIFIRNCEDRELEPKILISNLREWENKGSGQFIKDLNTFAYFDEHYNSKIFTNHLCDTLNIDNNILQKIIEGLYYTRDKSIYYDFSIIEADVLGNIYEQYLGHILKKTEKRAILTSNHTHRKKQGIYYTPTYIVEYIIRNTLGELLKDKKINVEEIRVLDLSCGSGSFLIKAFDVLNEYYYKKDKNYGQKTLADDGTTYSIKERILINNIFGVDLDKKAIEIAQLNLLLKIAERGHRLPLLERNIQNGNSLVDDPDIVGDNAFNWNERFRKQMIDDGGFSIIVGNPPYVFTKNVEFQELFKVYIAKNYLNASESISKSHARQSGKINLYALFLVKGIKLLKNNGLFGFIIPNNILRATTYDIVRKFILDNCKILKIVDLGAKVFEGVTVSTIILILERENDKIKRNKNKVTVYLDINNLSMKKEIEQKDFMENTSYVFNITLGKEERIVLEKIEKDTISLGEITIIMGGGIATGKNKKEMIEDYPKNSKYKKMLEGKDIRPYYPQFANRYILYDRKLLYRARDESIFLSSEKLITQRIGGGNIVLVVSYDDQQFYTFNSTNSLLPKDKDYSLKYLVALLNSKLLNWYYVNKFTNKSVLTVNISKTFLEQLPIKITFESQQQNIIQMVDKTLSLKKQLNEIGNIKTDKRARIEQETEKIDAEIDDLIYKLYRITEEEKKNIEESMK